MAIISAGFYIAVIVGTLTGNALLFYGPIAAGFIVAITVTMRAQPEPMERRRSETIRAFAAPVVLWISIKVTAHVLRTLGT
jgi:hypothetical protein